MAILNKTGTKIDRLLIFHNASRLKANIQILWLQFWEKVYFRSQILERPSIGEYWNISGVPVLPENLIFTSFRTCWCHSEAYNTGTQKWSSIVQYSCTSIWDLKYTFSKVILHFKYKWTLWIQLPIIPLPMVHVSLGDKNLWKINERSKITEKAMKNWFLTFHWFSQILGS